jgi:hypothetical protein
MSSDTNSGKGSVPDWRDPEQYRHLLDLDRAGWAWEWLRRNPDYIGTVPELPATELERKGAAELAVIPAANAEESPHWGLTFRRDAHTRRRPRALCLAQRIRPVGS